MVSTRKQVKNFLKILVSSAPNRGPTFKKIQYFGENAGFLALIFLQLYLTVMQYIAGKNALNRKE